MRLNSQLLMLGVGMVLSGCSRSQALDLEFQSQASGPDMLAFRDIAVFSYGGPSLAVPPPSFPVQQGRDLGETPRVLGSATRLHVHGACVPQLRLAINGSDVVEDWDYQVIEHPCPCGCVSASYTLEYHVYAPESDHKMELPANQTLRPVNITSWGTIYLESTCTIFLDRITRFIYTIAGTRTPFHFHSKLRLVNQAH